MPAPDPGAGARRLGFVRRSAPARSTDKTLASMLEALGAPADALVVMDAGIATEANIAWLRENGYRYLAVSRERTRRFDPDRRWPSTRSRQTVHGGRRRRWRGAALLLLPGRRRNRARPRASRAR